MKYFPMFVNVYKKEVVICGGGKRAIEKISKLKPFGAILRVVSPDLSDEILNLEGIYISRKSFTRDDLDSHPVFVVAAEDKRENERISAVCRAENVLVNAVDQPSECDFIFPSIFATDMLCIGVSTGGASPTAGIALRDMITNVVPHRIDDILSWLVEAREIIREKTDDKSTLNKTLRSAVSLSFALGRPLTESELDQIDVEM